MKKQKPGASRKLRHNVLSSEKRLTRARNRIERAVHELVQSKNWDPSHFHIRAHRSPDVGNRIVVTCPPLRIEVDVARHLREKIDQSCGLDIAVNGQLILGTPRRTSKAQATA